MYCGSCLHDNTLAAELLRQGQDVILVPIYTPLRTDEDDVSLPRVFFGGINVYLQQKWALFRRIPRWLDRWLDHPALLRLATRGASAVDPAALGELTVSMLRGAEGNQRKELENLVDWLIDDVRPDVVHLSNSLMLGLAPLIAERGGLPIVCSLSGEDIFLEKLGPPHYDEARQLLRERAGSVHVFVAQNTYFADFMADYLGIERSQIEAIPHGLNLAGHGLAQEKPAGAPLRIGYLARICHDKGLHLLVEACELLAQRTDLPEFELHAAGYLGAGDKQYFEGLQRRVESGALSGKFHYAGELNRPQKIAFLQALDVFSTPTVYRESKGLPVLEALANGVPVVLPEHGAFPEMIAATGGGRLFAPHDTVHLAQELARLLLDPETRRDLGNSGRDAVVTKFHAGTMAEQTMRLYEHVLLGTSRNVNG